MKNGWTRLRLFAKQTGKVCIVLYAALGILLLSGCSTLPHSNKHPTEVSSSVSNPDDLIKPPSVITLSYSEKDTLNPYTCNSSINLDLMPLLFEGLTNINADYTSSPQLAAGITLDGKTAIATLRSDAVFSDGSPVTVDDIISSFQAAKKSENFGELVAPVSAVYTSGDKAVGISFSMLTPAWKNALSFPIIKKDSNIKEPIGSGRYILKVAKGNSSLSANPKAKVKPKHDTLQLQNVTNNDAMLHALENGSVSCYFTDLSNGEIPRTSSAIANPALNHLVFLGINANRTDLSHAEVRQAISTAISRNNLVSSGYSGRAQAATTPFYPAWKDVNTIKGFSVNENINAAVALLDKAGYNTSGTSGSKEKKDLSLELLVNKENAFRDTVADLLKQQLASVGIKLTIKTLSFKNYRSQLKRGNFDLYLGEIQLSSHLGLYPFFSSGGAASYGIRKTPATGAYQQYVSGDTELSEFVTAFCENVPFVPLCFRKGIFAYNRALTGVSPTPFDIYANIDNWKFA